MIELELASGAKIGLYVMGALAYPTRVLTIPEIDEIQEIIAERELSLVLQASYAPS